MSASALVVLVVVAAVAAALSAVTGVAGGIVLLSALLITLDARAVVPIHGAVQLIANCARLAVFWREVRWAVVVRFSVASVPGAIVGALLVASMSPRVLQIAIAIAILASLPGRSRPSRPLSLGHLRWFYPLGFVCGGLGMLVGSTGPLVTQALLLSGVTKEPHIATKAACQAVANVIKLLLYGTTLGFAFAEHAPTIALLGLAAVTGTLVGRRILRRMSDTHFVLGTKVLLAAISVKILLAL